MAKSNGYVSIDIERVSAGDILVHEQTGLTYQVVRILSTTSVEIEAYADGALGNLPVGSRLDGLHTSGSVLFLRGGADELPPPRVRTAYERLIEDD